MNKISAEIKSVDEAGTRSKKIQLTCCWANFLAIQRFF